MKQILASTFAVIVFSTLTVVAQKAVDIPNPSIDMKGFLKVAAKAAKYRETRRLTEDEFINMSTDPDVVVLDARSKRKFDELHIQGAINLSFPDITVDSLAAMLPDKNATILIYCNNNFVNTAAFPVKRPEASLNISTYISLYTYGYRNIYELGPLLDVKTTKLNLVATDKPVVAGQ
ncbi:MAG TPA: rhodanese-like domain-containing protein [Pyrinomonadaceae bacterium]|nr:rhodanese-like domain-containing protein [Pyrinomonadaceae bacterium]